MVYRRAVDGPVAGAKGDTVIRIAYIPGIKWAIDRGIYKRVGVIGDVLTGCAGWNFVNGELMTARINEPNRVPSLDLDGIRKKVLIARISSLANP